MAIITTTVTVPATRLALIAPLGEPDIWWTPYPRAELVFNSYQTAVTLAGVGDTQALAINCALPVSYAYVLVDLTMFLYSVNADDWLSGATVQLQDATVPTWAYVIPVETVAKGNDGTFETRTWFPSAGLPQKTILATSAGAGLNLDFYNPTTNGAAATIRFFARFLQYDLNQGFRTSVNTPALIR